MKRHYAWFNPPINGIPEAHVGKMPVIALAVIPGMGQWMLAHLDPRKPQPENLPDEWREMEVAIKALDNFEKI